VQVIKAPTLLEICGPMFMSYAAAGHIQWRLTEEGGSTRLVLTHTAIGLIAAEVLEGAETGWGHKLARVGEIAAGMARGGGR
jgi:hypothetical protein